MISSIQNELKKNGSLYATIETDEGCTFFLIDIPCHPESLKEEKVVSTLYQALDEAVGYWRKSDSYGGILKLLTILLIRTESYRIQSHRIQARLESYDKQKNEK